MTLRAAERRRLAVALVLSAVGVVVFVFGPTGDLPSTFVSGAHQATKDLGAPWWLSDPRVWEFVFNIFLFLPPAALCCWLWPRVASWVWVAGGFALSLSIESTQALLLSGRTPQIRDLVANTMGAAVGLVLARWRLGRSGVRGRWRTDAG